MLALRKTAKRRIGGDSLHASWSTRQVARLLIAVIAIPLGGTASGLAQQTPPSPPPVPSAPAKQAPPSTEVASSSLLPIGEAGTPDAPQPQNAPVPANTQNPPQQEQQNNPQNPQQPLGTAVAPYEQPSGITASRPAGAAIAPAKQKRTRTILIRVGVLVAAGVALGTVVGLSSASPSTPH